MPSRTTEKHAQEVALLASDLLAQSVGLLQRVIFVAAEDLASARQVVASIKLLVGEA